MAAVEYKVYKDAAKYDTYEEYCEARSEFCRRSGMPESLFNAIKAEDVALLLDDDEMEEFLEPEEVA